MARAWLLGTPWRRRITAPGRPARPWPCCCPSARQGGQSGYRAIGPLPFGNEIAIEPLVVRLQRGDVFAKHIHKFRIWGFARLFARLFSGRTHNVFVCEPFRRRIVHARAPVHSAARTVRANG
jgi:hypothetical protein